VTPLIDSVLRQPATTERLESTCLAFSPVAKRRPPALCTPSFRCVITLYYHAVLSPNSRPSYRPLISRVRGPCLQFILLGGRPNPKRGGVYTLRAFKLNISELGGQPIGARDPTMLLS
jgi:hypothetical protein